MAGELVNHIVTVKTKQDIEPAKELAKKQGGKIGRDFSIGDFVGFEVGFPSDSVSALDSSPHVKAVEIDGKVSTQ